MKNVRFASSLFQVAGCLIIVAALVAWQPCKTRTAQQKNYRTAEQDTSLPKSANINQIDIQLNLDSAMRQVNLAMSKIDYAKMNADVQKAMAQIDYKKINKEITAAMKSIDWSQMKMDISKSLDSAKMEIDKINWDEMKTEVNRAQLKTKNARATQKINTDSIRIQVQKSLREAQKNLQTVKVELINYQGLKSALEKDGLLNISKPYSIELKDGILYLNGIKQSKTTTDKYSRYYSGKKNFTLKGDGGTDL